MRTEILYLRDLSLLLSLVYYCNSTIVILERFLPYYASVLISTTTLTSICHITFLRLNLGKIFDSHYWNAFLLTSAYHITADDSSSWNSWRARLLLVSGLSFLTVYVVAVRIMSYVHPSEENAVDPGTVITPLLVEISFLFIGNGVAMMGRGLIPKESFESAIVGAALMLAVALLFFYCFVRCSFQIEAEIHPHTE